jgi:hypothetical protein
VRPAVRSWDLAQAARSPGCAAATVPPATEPDVVIELDAEPAAAATATTEATATAEATATSAGNKPAPTATMEAAEPDATMAAPAATMAASAAPTATMAAPTTTAPAAR